MTTFFGYLEAAYLIAPYMSAFVTNALPLQIDQKITALSPFSQQIDQRLVKDSPRSMQLDRRATGELVPIKGQIDLEVQDDSTVSMQIEAQNVFPMLYNSSIERHIDNGLSNQLSQIEFSVEDQSWPLSQELEGRLVKGSILHGQLDRQIDTSSFDFQMELGRGPVSHQICDGYLLDPYLTTSYLAPEVCAHLRMQQSHRLAKTSAFSFQLDRRIKADTDTRTQMKRQVIKPTLLKTQISRQSTYAMRSQLVFGIYNATNLRILYEFPSRGTSGTNWSVVAGGTTAGDFDVNNLNTDIVEQVYRSTSTTITIQCDTEVSQGIFADTLAILGHNFTTSAVVTFQGSNDVSFSSILFSEGLSVERENIYWVSQYLPLTSYRYWRLVISDSTNPSGYIQIGTVVFGSAVIFNGECFVDEVTRRKTHFADRIRTEGYSSMSNDRALKRSVSLTFRRLDFNRENFANLEEVIDTTRTSLKALWIPTPQYASRFAVFGKLAEIPTENHKAISATADYIDLDITVDEAL